MSLAGSLYRRLTNAVRGGPGTARQQLLRHYLVIVAVSSAAMFVNLGATRLWDQDEAYFAGAAAEMHERGDWITPYFNRELFAHKPPLMYWLMIAGYELLGVSEFAARCGSAVCGVATALLVYHLGRKLFSPGAGLWAALATATCLMFAVVARAATPDCYLVFFSTLAIYCFAALCDEGKRALGGDTHGSAPPPLPVQPTSAAQPSPPTTPHPSPLTNALGWSLVYAAMGLAVLTKGPIGVLLPAATIGLFLMLARPRGGLPTVSWRQAAWQFARRFSPLNFAWCAWRMRPLLGLAVVALVAGPWFLAVHLRTEGAFLHEFIWKHHVERFIEPLDNHQGPWWYYAPAMLAGFFPWSVFAIPALIEAVRTLRRGGRRGRAMLLLACWAAVYVVFFSKASTKLPNYVLPAYPALALAVGWFIDRWLRRPRRIGVWWPRASFGILALVGVAMIALPAAARLGGENGVSVFEQLGIAPGFEQPLQLVGWLGVVLVVGGLACLVCDLLALRRLATTVMAVSSLAFVIAALGGVALSVDRLQTSEALARAIRESGSAKPRVAEFGYFRPSLVYYTRGRLESCARLEDAARFLTQSPHSYLVTPGTEYQRLKPLLPSDAFVLRRVPQFPKRGEIVLLARGAK